jgi:uncharacterized membrane protein YoaK (UPF0700 family)
MAATNELNLYGRKRRPSSLSADPRLALGTSRDLLLVGLAVGSGALDAISYLALGKVFTAFMTGNIVFLGLRTGGTGGQDVLRIAISLAAFATGVFVAVKIVKPSKGSAVWPRRVSITLGFAALALACFFAGWLATSGHPSTSAGDLLVGMGALAMGLQSGSVLSLGVSGVFTTAATATLINLIGDLAGRRHPEKERRRLAGVLGGVVAGAAGGAFLLAKARSYAPILPLMAIILVIALSGLIATAERRHGTEP